MATTDNAEWTLYDTDLTTKLAILPVSNSHLYFELNEPGSGELKIPLDTTAAGLITVGMFVACDYRGSYRGGVFVDNIKKEEAGANEGGGRWLSVSGRGALALLEDAIVGDGGNTASTRTFSSVTRAYVLKTVIDEAQARGALSPLAYDFTATDDSDSVAWTDSSDYTLTVGSTILDVLRQFAAIGTEFSISFSAGTFTLSAYQSEIGTNKSSTIFFRVGTNCEEVSSDERGRDIANALTVGYQNGSVSVTDATSISAYRRREKFLDARLAQSLSSATTYATAQLQVTKDPRKSITVRIYDGVSPNLFLDYVLGDYITLDVMGTETSYRVLGLQCDFDGVSYSNVVVEMNTVIHDARLELEERLSWLTQQWQTAHDDNRLETSVWGKFTLNCDSTITALLLDGDNLYVGGEFTTIGPFTTCYGLASVNVKTGAWTNIGVEESGGAGLVYALAKDALGNVYIGGYFDTIAGVSANSIAKLVTSTGVYSAMTSGLAITASLGWCYALAVTSTNVLWVGGEFNTAGGISTVAVAWWDGSWHGDAGALITIGYSGRIVYAMDVDGSNNVYAGGDFTKGVAAKANRIAMWNGSAWEELDTGLASGIVYAIAVNSSGNAYVGGTFNNAGGIAAADRIAYWNGTAWAAVGGSTLTGFNNVRALHIDLYGNLYIGWSTSFGSSTGLARYSGGNWLEVGTSPNTGTDGDVFAIQTSTTGDLYIGGSFYRAGDIEADASGTGLNLAVYLTTFQAVMDYVNSGAGNSHNPVTIGTANGLSITDTQVLSMALAGASTIGAISTSAQTIAGVKTFSSDPLIPDEAYDATAWNGSLEPPTKNAIRDKFESLPTFPLSAANGGTGIANGASASLTLPNLAITLGGGGAAQTYTLPAVGGTFALLNAANVFTTQQFIDGSSDQIQLRVQGHSTQTANLQTWEKSDGTVLGSVRLLTATGELFIGIGTALPDAPFHFLTAGGKNMRIAGAGLGTGANWISDTTTYFGTTSGSVFFYANNSEKIFIQGTTGNVNINTASVNLGAQLGVLGTTTNIAYFISNTAGTNAIRDVLKLESTSTGTAAAGLGAGILYSLETATGGTNQTAGVISASWVDATNATRKAKLSLSAYDTAARLGLEIEATGTVPVVTTYGGQVRPYVAKTADYTLTRGDYVVDVTANSVNITLPTAVGCTGQIYQINNSGTGTLTILTTSSQTINGDASGVVQLAQWEQVTVISDGTNWKVIY